MSNNQLVSNMSNYQLVSNMSNYQLVSNMSNYPLLNGTNNNFLGSTLNITVNYHQQYPEIIRLYYQMLQGQIQLLDGLFQALHIIFVFIAQPIHLQTIGIYLIRLHRHQHIYYLKHQP